MKRPSRIAKTVKVNSSGSEERKIRMQGYGEDVSRFTFVVIGQRKERNFLFLLVDKILSEIWIRFSFSLLIFNLQIVSIGWLAKVGSQEIFDYRDWLWYIIGILDIIMDIHYDYYALVVQVITFSLSLSTYIMGHQSLYLLHFIYDYWMLRRYNTFNESSSNNKP